MMLVGVALLGAVLCRAPFDLLVGWSLIWVGIFGVGWFCRERRPRQRAVRWTAASVGRREGVDDVSDEEARLRARYEPPAGWREKILEARGPRELGEDDERRIDHWLGMVVRDAEREGRSSWIMWRCTLADLWEFDFDEDMVLIRDVLRERYPWLRLELRFVGVPLLCYMRISWRLP